MPERQFHYAWEWRVPATPSALWPLISDTNRFNRDAGVPPVTELAGSTPGSRRLSLRRHGVLVEWEEFPFEWIRPRSFGVVRRYSSGPVKEMRVLTKLEPDGDSGTIVHYDVTAMPANALGMAAIPFEIGIVSKHRFERVIRKYAQLASASAAASAPYMQHRVDMRPSRAVLAPGADARLARIRATLSEDFADDLVDRLIDVVTRGDDVTVARLRAYVLADLWQAKRRTVLDLCLHATRAGLLDLQWDVLCPMCRGAKQTNKTMQGIAQPVHCESCNIDFFANFEQQVELTFRVNPGIRVVEIFPFCVGGPQITPHIVMQQAVDASGTRNVEVDLESGRYRVRSAGLPGGQMFRAEVDGKRRIELIASDQGWPDTEQAVAMRSECALTNQTKSEQLMIVERLAWSDQALTASEVIALQEFRDLFSSEALRPGEAISVGRMAILFTDLLNSTRLYREIGDAPAFGRVMSHFDVLRQAMHEEEGALVKTIGDAVMAVFRQPAAAIRTILRAQQLLAALPAGVRPSDLKAGIHFGPCIAVTLNERLDYFGSTVNIAARIGALSQGGEVVISDIVAMDPEVEALLSESNVDLVPFQASLKGYEEAPLALTRITSRKEG